MGSRVEDLSSVQLVRGVDKSDPPVGPGVKKILSMKLVVGDVTERTEGEDADPHPLFDSAAAAHKGAGLFRGML